MMDSPFHFRAAVLALGLALAATAPVSRAQGTGAAPRAGDHIVAVVNQELVTNSEVQTRIRRLTEDAARNRQQLPPPAELRRLVVEGLIDERVQLTYAREAGVRIDDAELDRAVANVAVQNQLTMAQLRERLARDGIAYARFRTNVRDQMITERVREREVQGRIRVNDIEIDAYLDKRRAAMGAAAEYNIAQILVTVREGATAAETAERRARAEAAQARVKAGEAFDAVAREISEDGNRAKGGEIGLRPADRLPDVFVDAVRPLKAGEVAPNLLRSGAGFHLLKLVDKKEADAFKMQQTRARHILLRVSAQLPEQAALARLAGFKQQIEAGTATFEQLARANSEDGSAPQGGDLGWAAPGMFVPEFEQAMAKLPVRGISDPVVSRFGVHLIQVVERREVAVDPKQIREQARNTLREQKFEEAYTEWLRDLRARAYIEMRDAPL